MRKIAQIWLLIEKYSVYLCNYGHTKRPNGHNTREAQHDTMLNLKGY